MNNLRIFYISVVVLLTTTTVAMAANQQIYYQQAGSINSGGGIGSSTNYTILSSIGQSEAIGVVSTTNYTLDPGLIPVLGGLRILYPVIAVTPGSFSFNLMSGASANQPLSITNSGGSTLLWNIAKSDPAGTVFTVSPSSGAAGAPVTITANAAGLAPGAYVELLTISGSGISQTLSVGLNLVVTASSYQLSVTVSSTVSGKGGGSINSSPSGISCTSGTCSANFIPGTTVNLYQTPDSNSTWGTWSLSGCGINSNCQVVMNGPTSVTNTFDYAYLAKVNSTGSRFDTLAAAYGNAAASDIIYARNAVFSENLTLSSLKTVRLLGGYDAYYAPLNAWATVQGRLSINSGTLIVDRLIVK